MAWWGWMTLGIWIGAIVGVFTIAIVTASKEPQYIPMRDIDNE